MITGWSLLRNTAALCFVGAVFAAGCGSGRPPTAPVHGRITCGGRLVSSGTVVFYPTKGRPASGQIQPDGTYTLTTFTAGDGALLGKHKVTVEATASSGGSADQPKTKEEEMRMILAHKRVMPPEVHWLAPARYAKQETSGLTAVVNRGDNSIDFTLDAK